MLLAIAWTVSVYAPPAGKERTAAGRAMRVYTAKTASTTVTVSMELLVIMSLGCACVYQGGSARDVRTRALRGCLASSVALHAYV